MYVYIDVISVYICYHLFRYRLVQLLFSSRLFVARRIPRELTSPPRLSPSAVSVEPFSSAHLCN